MAEFDSEFSDFYLLLANSGSGDRNFSRNEKPTDLYDISGLLLALTGDS